MSADTDRQLITGAPNFRVVTDQDTTDQEPYDIEVEQALLGSIMVRNEVLNDASRLLRAEHFYEPLHQRMFQAMLSLEEGQHDINPLTVEAALGDDPAFPELEVGGPGYLANLTDAAPDRPNVSSLASIVRNLAEHRSIIRTGEDIVADVYDAQTELSALAASQPYDGNHRTAGTTRDEAAEPASDEIPRSARPLLRIDKSDLPATADALRDAFVKSSQFFDRDGPALVVRSTNGHAPTITGVTVDHVVREAHRICRPVNVTNDNVTLPDRVARLFLSMQGEWGLRPLSGITTAPLLQADGLIHARDGYDPETQLWCHGVPDVAHMVPMTPMPDDVRAAVLRLRTVVRTFPFADAKRVYDGTLGVDVVVPDDSPGVDESAFLVALLTAVCRPSLFLAPGLIITAPAISGAGSGKGLLVRTISDIAFGIQPHAFTAGSEYHELDKRIAAELIAGSPMVFLDNANGMVLKSSTLESAMTERPSRIRILGESRTVEINSTAFVAATGNALQPSGDMARRFMLSELDAGCEDPEARPFKSGFLQWVSAQRKELLAAALTIWRWGRQNSNTLTCGKPLGSFEQWTEWCRDPLLTLGCCDPVERISEAKTHDPARQNYLAILEAWWSAHKDQPVKAVELADPVTQLINPHNKGRQFVAAELGKMVDTRMAGFVLTRSKGSGKWSVTTYALQQTNPQP